MISLIIPCFNCGDYIGGHLARLSAFLAAHFSDFEIVAVDDGSIDGTAQRLKECAQKDSRIKVIALGSNQGKGAAVKAGVLASQGDIIIFTDADLPYDLAAIPLCAKALEDEYDVVLG